LKKAESVGWIAFFPAAVGIWAFYEIAAARGHGATHEGGKPATEKKVKTWRSRNSFEK
jgi:hypothetical protein